MRQYTNDQILNDMADRLAKRYGPDLCDLRAKMGNIPGAFVAMTFVLEGHIPSDGPNTVRRTSFTITPSGDGEVEVIASLSVDDGSDDDDDGSCQCGAVPAAA